MKQFVTHSKPIVAAIFVSALFWGGNPLVAQANGDKIAGLYDQLAQATQAEAESLAKEIRYYRRQTGSPSVDVLLNRGQDALDAQEFVNACEQFSAVVDFAPDITAGYYGRAQCYVAQELIGPAFEDLRSALLIDPHHFDALALLGQVFEYIQDYDLARRTYDQVLAIHPHYQQVITAQERLKQAQNHTPL